MFAFGYEIRVELSSDACRHQTSHATGAPAKSIPVAFSSRVFNLVATCRLDDVRQSPNVVSQTSPRVWKRSAGTIPGISGVIAWFVSKRVVGPVLETFPIFQGIRVIFILFHGRITVNRSQL